MVGTVGCSSQYSRDPYCSIYFSILGDNRVLWSSGKITRAGQSQDFKISVSNVQTLALVVRLGGTSTSYAYAVWGDPVLSEKRKR